MGGRPLTRSRHHNHPLLSLWFRALHSPLGIYITTPDPADLRTRLNSVKHQNASDEDRHALRAISIRTSPKDPGGELWLVRTPDEELP